MSILEFHDRIVALQSVDLFLYVGEIPELKLLQGCDQSNLHHAEGNVLIHSQMAGQIVLHLLEEEEIDPQYKPLIYLATILHDIGKPKTSVFNSKKNKITAYGHDTAGVPLANEFMRKYFPEFSYKQREVVCRLIEWHMQPRMWMKDETCSVTKLKMLSLSLNVKHLYVLSQADTLGRTATDMSSGMFLLELFKQNCEDLGVWNRLYRIPLATSLDDASYSLARWNILMNGAPEDYDTYETAQEIMIQPPKPNFQLMLLIGAPGSGKSTIREKLLSQYPGIKVISMDDHRKELTGDANNQSKNNEVFAWQQRTLNDAMENRENVIVDATNPTRKLRKILWEMGRRNGALCSAIYFDIPLATLHERNKAREKCVPDAVVERFYYTLQSVSPWEADLIQIIDK
jgi:putative nucleotidyltransferase with HDIG domain